jgi:hypothetical protein
MPTSTLPTSSISPIHNNSSEIYTTTPVQSTFSQEQLEKVQKHAVQLADVLRKVTAKHHSDVGTDTMILTRKASVLPSLLEQDCEDCDTSITHKVTSTLHRTIDLDKFSCHSSQPRSSVQIPLRLNFARSASSVAELYLNTSIDYGQPKTSEQYFRYLKRCLRQRNQSRRRNLSPKSSTVTTWLNGQPFKIGKWCVHETVGIRTLTLSNPCGKRIALQSFPLSTLLKFSIICQHNLVDEALILYYSAYVKHAALSFYSLLHYHSIGNICTHPNEI